mmetsp:Transcript_23840/g.58874  ORF Transcript_23840/g.58874 Transcript_23840/m.58874 type:complete len:308 (-) Transcript_23840:1600-2523(-)
MIRHVRKVGPCVVVLHTHPRAQSLRQATSFLLQPQRVQENNPEGLVCVCNCQGGWIANHECTPVLLVIKASTCRQILVPEDIHGTVRRHGDAVWAPSSPIFPKMLPVAQPPDLQRICRKRCLPGLQQVHGQDCECTPHAGLVVQHVPDPLHDQPHLPLREEELFRVYALHIMLWVQQYPMFFGDVVAAGRHRRYEDGCVRSLRRACASPRAFENSVDVGLLILVGHGESRCGGPGGPEQMLPARPCPVWSRSPRADTNRRKSRVGARCALVNSQNQIAMPGWSQRGSVTDTAVPHIRSVKRHGCHTP